MDRPFSARNETSQRSQSPSPLSVAYDRSQSASNSRSSRNKSLGAIGAHFRASAQTFAGLARDVGLQSSKNVPSVAKVQSRWASDPRERAKGNWGLVKRAVDVLRVSRYMQGISSKEEGKNSKSLPSFAEQLRMAYNLGKREAEIEEMPAIFELRKSFRRLNAMVFLMAMVGVLLTVLEVELVWFEGRKPNQVTEALKFLVSLSTLATVWLLYRAYSVEMNILKLKKRVVEDDTLWSSGMWKMLVLEALIILFHVPPFLRWSREEVTAKGDRAVRDIEWVGVYVFVRLYLGLKLIRDYYWRHTTTYFYGALNNLDLSVPFTIRTLLHYYPMRCLIFAVALEMGTTSYILWVLERDFPSSLVQAYPDAIWLICISMTTVGYGDYSPSTYSGRLVVTVSIILGITMSALFTAVMFNNLSLTPREKLFTSQCLRSLWKIKTSMNAATTIQRLWREHTRYKRKRQELTMQRLAYKSKGITTVKMPAGSQVDKKRRNVDRQLQEMYRRQVSSFRRVLLRWRQAKRAGAELTKRDEDGFSLREIGEEIREIRQSVSKLRGGNSLTANDLRDRMLDGVQQPRWKFRPLSEIGSSLRKSRRTSIPKLSDGETLGPITEENHTPGRSPYPENRLGKFKGSIVLPLNSPPEDPDSIRPFMPSTTTVSESLGSLDLRQRSFSSSPKKRDSVVTFDSGGISSRRGSKSVAPGQGAIITSRRLSASLVFEPGVVRSAVALTALTADMDEPTSAKTSPSPSDRKARSVDPPNFVAPPAQPQRRASLVSDNACQPERRASDVPTSARTEVMSPTGTEEARAKATAIAMEAKPSVIRIASDVQMGERGPGGLQFLSSWRSSQADEEIPSMVAVMQTIKGVMKGVESLQQSLELHMATMGLRISNLENLVSASHDPTLPIPEAPS